MDITKIGADQRCGPCVRFDDTTPYGTGIITDADQRGIWIEGFTEAGSICEPTFILWESLLSAREWVLEGEN